VWVRVWCALYVFRCAVMHSGLNTCAVNLQSEMLAEEEEQDQWQQQQQQQRAEPDMVRATTQQGGRGHCFCIISVGVLRI